MQLLGERRSTSPPHPTPLDAAHGCRLLWKAPLLARMGQPVLFDYTYDLSIRTGSHCSGVLDKALF